MEYVRLAALVTKVVHTTNAADPDFVRKCDEALRTGKGIQEMIKQALQILGN